MSLPAIADAPSPNFDGRTAPPDMVILHYTGMPSGEAALERLRDPAAKVSAHYLVEEDGRVGSKSSIPAMNTGIAPFPNRRSQQ